MKISVVMGVYNGAAFLADAIESILRQTCADFEFIIVNDGSTDNSRQIILSYHDPRIRYFDNNANRGLPYTLNFGFEQARTAYIARMDADDVARPDRLARQLAFMDANPEVGICGGAINYIGAKRGVWRAPLTDGAIKAKLFWDCPFAHPTVMIRRTFWQESGVRYPENAPGAEDYTLWVESAGKTKFANLPRVLLNYRVHPQQKGKTDGARQEQDGAAARLTALRSYFGLELADEEERLHRLLLSGARGVVEWDLRKTAEWVNFLGAVAQDQTFCDGRAFRRELGKRWLRLCRRAKPSYRGKRRIMQTVRPEYLECDIDFVRSVFYYLPYGLLYLLTRVIKVIITSYHR